MTVLADSDWVADYLAGKPAAVTLIDSLMPGGLAVCLITVGELYEGIYYGRDPRQSETIFREFLRAVDVLPLNLSIMRRFARIRGDLRRRGLIIGDPDILIAATAVHYDLGPLTRNQRHFGRVAGLRLHPTP